MYRDVAEVQARICELEKEIFDWLESEEDDETVWSTVNDLNHQRDHLADAIKGLDAQLGLVAEDNFKDEAQQLAEDIDGIDINAWPFYYIDWERAADELRGDYCEVEIDGVTYLYR